MKTLEEFKTAILTAKTKEEIDVVAKEIEDAKSKLINVWSDVWIDADENMAYAYWVDVPMETKTLDWEEAKWYEEYIDTLESN